MENQPVQLCQFGRGWRVDAHWRLPNGSPFCLKVETFLRMHQISYQLIVTNDPRKAPHSKLPFINYQGQTIADSQRIIEFLWQQFPHCKDDWLTKNELANTYALRMLMERHLIGIIAYSRFKDPAGWAIMRKARLKGLPPILGQFIVGIMQKRIHQFLRCQELLEISQNDVYRQGERDLDVLSQQLGSTPYFFGDKPSLLDAVAFGFLANLLWDPMPTSLKQVIRSQRNLLDFCERMRESYYPNDYWRN